MQTYCTTGGRNYRAARGVIVALSIRRGAAHSAPRAVAHMAAGAPTSGAARAAQTPIAGRALAGAIYRHADGAARHHRARNLIAEIIVGLQHATADDPRRIAIGRIARAIAGVNREHPRTA